MIERSLVEAREGAIKAKKIALDSSNVLRRELQRRGVLDADRNTNAEVLVQVRHVLALCDAVGAWSRHMGTINRALIAELEQVEPGHGS